MHFKIENFGQKLKEAREKIKFHALKWQKS